MSKSEQLREGLAASQKKLADIEEKRRKETSEKQNLDNLIHTLQAQISNLKSNAKKLEKDKGVYLYLLDKKMILAYLALALQESEGMRNHYEELKEEKRLLSEKMSESQATINELGRSLAETQVCS